MLTPKHLLVIFSLLALLVLQACVSEQKLGIHVKPTTINWAEPEILSLHRAIRSGDLQSVSQVLDAKGNSNAIAANGATPLYALFQGSPFPGGTDNRYKIARALFRVGANPNEFLPDRLSAGGVRVATWALSKEPAQMTQLFLDAGLNPSLAGAVGQSILFAVVRANNIEATGRLLSAGAYVNHIDSFGQNCLFHARTPEMGKFLVERGANFHQRNSEGKSIIEKLRDQSGYCGSGGCSDIPPEELALAKYLESIGAPK